MYGKLMLAFVVGCTFFLASRVVLTIAMLITPSIATEWHGAINVYKAFAHVWVGGPLFLWMYFKSQDMFTDAEYMRYWFWTLSIVEVICAAITFLIKRGISL